MKILIINLFLISLTASGSVVAQCGPQHAGPLGNKASFYYSSTCFDYGKNSKGVRIRNQVCSISGRLAFRWTKLNWVSGSSGVKHGYCLIRDNFYSRARNIAGSEIIPNIGYTIVTDVYAPDVNPQENNYSEEVDGYAQSYEGGAIEPFQFLIQYSKVNNGIRLYATMNGDLPAFYIVLPKFIKNRKDLDKFISTSNTSKISDFVRFDGKLLVKKISDKDILLRKFSIENSFSKRMLIEAKGYSNQRNISINFILSASIVTLAKEMDICLGSSYRVSTCFSGVSTE